MITPEEADMCLQILKSTTYVREDIIVTNLREAAAKKLLTFISEPDQNG